MGVSSVSREEQCLQVLNVLLTAVNGSPVQGCQVPSSVYPTLFPLKSAKLLNAGVCSCWDEIAIRVKIKSYVRRTHFSFG